jgi:hypothetical protein
MEWKSFSETLACFEVYEAAVTQNYFVDFVK